MKNLSFIIMLCMVAIGQRGLAQSGIYSNENNVAINGYDLVAYFNRHEAVRGEEVFSYTSEGKKFYFASAANKDAFKADPQKYLPQFDGYCAFAVAMKNTRVPSDPRTFKLRDGKLYLFFNDYYEGQPFNTIVPWNASETQLLSKAEANWQSLK